jgi:hypothetical protein
MRMLTNTDKQRVLHRGARLTTCKNNLCKDDTAHKLQSGDRRAPRQATFHGRDRRHTNCQCQLQRANSVHCTAAHAKTTYANTTRHTSCKLIQRAAAAADST